MWSSGSTASRGLPVWPLAWACGVVPALAVVACTMLSMHQGLVPSCVPFVDGCTTVSATGRHGAPYFIFKALVIPGGVLLMAFWLIAGLWCLHLQRRLASIALLGAGIGGGLFLILYATFLGSDGLWYDWLRRFGARMFFTLTAFAQLLLTAAAWHGLAQSRRPQALHGMLWLCLLQLIIGVTSLPAPWLLENPDAVQNIVEWNYGLAMLLFFPAAGQLMHRQGLRMQIALSPGAR